MNLKISLIKNKIHTLNYGKKTVIKSSEYYRIWIASIDIWINISLAVTNDVDFKVFHHFGRH